jgi:thiol-disulfide isomerase/thioredoxin
MSVITIGSDAPPVPGIDLLAGPRALYFYKVTCPVCQMTAPLVERLAAAAPGLVAGVGQDPADKLAGFAREYDWTFDSEPDLPPYDVSEAYGIRVVPTLVVVDDGKVTDLMESWDRDAWNRAASRLAELTGASIGTLSDQGDGLPSFRPG